MSIVLLILKIIGMILLTVLCVVLFLLILLLFAPIRYQIMGRIMDEKSVRVKVTWLFPLLAYYFFWDGEKTEQYLKICGIRKKTKEKASEEDFSEEDLPEEDFPEEASFDEDLLEEHTHQVEESANAREESKDMVRSTIEKETSQEGLWNRITGRIHDFFQKIRNTVSHLKDTISNIKTVVLDETNQKVVKLILAETGSLFKHFRFRKIDTEITFSLGDPATTGQVLGILCMMPFLYRYQVGIYPDFESEELYVRGTFDIRGRMRLVHVLISVIRLIKEPECRGFIKKILK